MIRLRPDVLRIDRDAFIEELRARNIGTSVHFIPLHLHPYYQQAWGYRPGAVPGRRGGVRAARSACRSIPRCRIATSTTSSRRWPTWCAGIADERAVRRTALRRALDVAVAGALLVAAAPRPRDSLALLVRATSPGPAFFRQDAGRPRRPAVRAAEAPHDGRRRARAQRPAITAGGDPRVTRLGARAAARRSSTSCRSS